MASRKSALKDHTDRPTKRSVGIRLIPYAIPHGLAATVPVAGLAAHAAWGGSPVITSLTSLAMAGGTVGLSTLAHHIGRIRETITRWQTTATVGIAGAGATGTLIIGPSPVWLQICGGAGLLTAFTWNLRRLDALRHNDGATQAEQDTWAQQLGLAKITPGKAKMIGSRVEIPLRHGVGETIKTVQGALPAIEAAAGVVPGRSRVVPNPDKADRSTLVLIAEDVLKDTIHWTGITHPNGCATDPIPLGVYEDDVPLELRLCGDGVIASHILWMGMSGAGKTITALIGVTELLTRRNIIIWWFDATKGEQSVGQIRHAFDHYADTVPDGKQMMKALKEIVKDRANALGRCGFDSWEPSAYDHPDLRMPLLFAHFEEASELVRDSQIFTWLTEKARSAGVIISVSMQRATATSMPTDARYNIGTALCFGVGDDYSAGFALSEATIAAGAHPENWGNRKSGYFYIEAPSIDETRFAVPLRSYFPDKGQLRQVVDSYADQRARRDPITMTAASRIFGGTSPADTPAVVIRDEDEEMPPIPPQPDEFAAQCDPTQVIPAFAGEDLVFGSIKPEAQTADEVAEAFDIALAAMADEGVTQIRPGDVMQRMPVRHKTWFSRRLKSIVNGEISPRGVTLERIDGQAGQYSLRRMAQSST